MIALLSILGHLGIVVCLWRKRLCPSDSLIGDRIDHGARSAPGMQAENETVVGKRLHEPECRPADAIVIVADGRCDDRSAFDQRLPCTAQSSKLRSLKMQFDEVGETPSESSRRVVTVFATVSARVRGRFQHRPMHHRECGRPTNDLPAAPSRSPGCLPISIIRARCKGMVNATLRLVVYLTTWGRSTRTGR